MRNYLLFMTILVQAALSARDSVAYLIFRDGEFPARQGYIKDGRKVVVCLNDGSKYSGRIILGNDSTFGLKTKNDSILNFRFKDVSLLKKVRRGQHAIGLTYLTLGVGIWTATIISNSGKQTVPSDPGGEESNAFVNFFNILLGSAFNFASLCNTHKKKFEPAYFKYKVIKCIQNPLGSDIYTALEK